MCHSPSFLSPPFSHAGQKSIPWMRWEWTGLAQLRKPGARSLNHSDFPSWEKPQAKKIYLAPKLCHLEMGDAGKAKLFLLPTLMSKLMYFAPTLCWNFSAGNLDFCKGSLICGWLSKTVFLGTYRLQPRRVRAGNRPLKGPQPAPRSLLPNYLTHSRQSSSLVPWYMMLDPTAPTKALLSMNGYQIVIVEVGLEGCRHKWGTSYSVMLLKPLKTWMLKFLHKDTVK